MIAPLLLALVASAQAAPRALLTAPAGDPLPGATVRLQLVTWNDDGTPRSESLPRIAARHGELLEVVPGERPGFWELLWQAPEVGDVAELLVGLDGDKPISMPVALGTPRTSTLHTEPQLTGRATGGGPLSLLVTGPDLPAPEDLRVVAAEGQVTAVTRTEQGLEVLWQPADVRAARVVPLGILDASRGGVPPIWVSARLRARVPVAVTTDPGTELSVRVAGRTYGPVIADESGRASTTVDLWPGEQRGEATLSDDLGNVQRTPIVLPGSKEPQLLVIADGELVTGATPPPLYLRAIDPRGQAWTGAAPECRGTGVGALGVQATGEGTWRATLPLSLGDLVQDLRVDCAIPSTAARWTLRIPTGRGMPKRLVLRVYPEELTGDFPVAQVQAHLEDLAGDRLAPTALILSAEHGELQPTPSDPLRVSADYTASLANPEDRIEARWNHPPGSGPLWDLRVALSQEGELLVRAVDRRRQPLLGIPIQVHLGAQHLQGSTGVRGWVALGWVPPTVPQVLEVSSGGVTRRSVTTPWSQLPLADPTGPDLLATHPIRIAAGRVREVYIDAEPGVLNTGDGDTARVTVRMLDRAGKPVRDEAVTVDADRGEITALKTLPDGTLEATYAPPAGLATGKVEVRAHGQDGSFAATTSLVLRPRPVRHSLSLVTGVMAGPGPRISPLVALDYETRFPLVERGLYVRVSTAGWVARTSVPDPDRGGEVALRMELLSVSASVLGRWQSDLWTVWAGGGPQVVPYRLEIRYPGVTPVSGFGLHQPGLVAFVGAGRRFRAGEFFGEVRGLGVSAYTEDFGFEGQLGGVAATTGFRLIF